MHIWIKLFTIPAIFPKRRRRKGPIRQISLVHATANKTASVFYAYVCVGMLQSDNQFQAPKVGRYHFITAEEGAEALAEITADWETLPESQLP